MKYAIFLTYVAFAIISHAVPISWDVDVSRVKPVQLEAYHGETLELSAQLSDPTGAATASFMWQTNGMGRSWWTTNATVTARGLVSARFTPAMDTGSERVTFFFLVNTSAGGNYRAAGVITLRPSPGANPTTATLPPPGSDLNLSEYNVLNAPWSTIDAVNAAVAAATNAIIIPPAPDLSAYATSAGVASAITAATNAIVIPPAPDLQPYCTVAAAEAMTASLSNGLSAALSAIQIPSLTGYATEQYVRDTVASNAPAVDLSPYATKAYADGVASNAVAGVQIPSLAGYATEQYVRDTVASNAPAVDLSPYATKSYAEGVASNAVAGVQIPSLAGYATEQYVLDTVASNAPAVDLSPYATKAYAEGVASNAVAGVQIPSLVGYATEQYVQSANAGILEDVERIEREITGIQMASADSNSTTRVLAQDGSEYVDGTGCVWRIVVSSATNWVDTSNGLVYRWNRSDPPIEYFTTDEIVLNIGGDRGIGELNFSQSENGLTFNVYTIPGSWGVSSSAYNVSPDTNLFSMTENNGMGTNTYMRVIYPVTNIVFKTRVAYTNDVVSQDHIQSMINSAVTAAGSVTPQIATNIATSAASNVVTKSYVDALGIAGGIDTNQVKAIIDAEVGGTNTITHGGPYLPLNGVPEWSHNSESAQYLLDENYRVYISGVSGGSTYPGIFFDPDYNLWQIVDNLGIGHVAHISQVDSVSNRLSYVENTVGSWQTYWDGDDVRVTVTNYYGSAGMPRLYIEEKMPTNETHASPWFKVVWDEMTRWTNFLSGYASFTNNAVQNYADRAWGVYDSSTGSYSPDGLLQISQEQIMIASGLAYQKTVTTGGCAVWVLKATEPQTISGVSSNGFFRIEDGDGNALFEIVKGDKRTVGATASAIIANNGMTITYNVVADEHPTLKLATDLNGTWYNETDCSSFATVSWSGSSGAYVATVTPVGVQTKMFARATYVTGGETYIRNTAPISAAGGILCTDGIHKVRPVYNGGNITWEEVVP